MTSIIFPLLILTVLIIVCTSSFDDALGLSPMFPRKMIEDDRGDYWINEARNVFPSGVFNSYMTDIPELGEITYLSNGRTLNATLWLDKPFEKKPNVELREYAMNLSVPDSLGNEDYMTRLLWQNKTWSRETLELSSDGQTRITNIENVSDFSDRNSVSLSFDLEDIALPETYEVAFDVRDIRNVGGTVYDLFDQSEDVTISNPVKTKVNVSVPKNNIEMYPGENASIQVQLICTPSCAETTQLMSQTIEGVETKFKPELLDTFNSSRAPFFSDLYLKISSDAVPKIYAIPIHAYTYCSNAFMWGTGFRCDDNSITEGSTQLIVRVITPATNVERFQEFWVTYGSSFTVILGAFAGGFVGWLFAKKRK